LHTPLLTFLGLAILLSGARADSSTAESNGLRVTIESIAPVTAYDTAVPVRVAVDNQSDAPLKGSIVVGGPTSGLYPVGPVSQPFAVAAKSQTVSEFKVAFDRTCLSAWYPIHAFVQVTDGGDGNLQAVRLVETRFADQDLWAMEPAGTKTWQASWPEGPGAFVARTKMEAVIEFLRSNQPPIPDRVFRLGKGPNDFTFLAVLGSKGLMNGSFVFAGPDRDLYFNGLRLVMNTLPGLTEDGELDVLDYELLPQKDGFDVKHQIAIGGLTSEVTVEVRVRDGVVRLRAISPDPVTAFGLGPANRPAASVIAGDGERITPAERWEAGAGSPYLATSYAGFEFEGGVFLLQGSDRPLAGIELAPPERTGRVLVPGEAWLEIVPSPLSVWDAAARYRPFRASAASPGLANLRGRIWVGVESGSYADLSTRLSELKRYDVSKLALSIGLPGVWPLDGKQGTLAELQRVGKACRDAGILWGLREDYGWIDPASNGFSYQQVAFGADSLPILDKSFPQTPRYALRPDRVRAYLDRNLRAIRTNLAPTLSTLSGAGLTPGSYFGMNGAPFTPQDSLTAWRGHFAFAQEYIGPEGATVADQGGDWLAGTAAAIAVPAQPPVENSVRMPWSAVVDHARLLRIDPAASGTDREMVLDVMDGRIPSATQADFGRALTIKSWFIQPITQLLAEASLDRVEPANGNPQQLTLTWSNGAKVWTNLGAQPWDRGDGLVIPPTGFRVEHPKLAAAIEFRDGVFCEQSVRAGTRYVNARPRLPGQVRVRPSAGNLARDAGNKAVLALNLACEEPMPVDAELVVLANGREVGRAPFPFLVMGKPVTSLSVPLDFTNAREADLDLTVQAVTPNGRIIRLLGPTGLGRAKITRSPDGSIGALEFQPRMEEKPAAPDTSRANLNRKTVEFDWVRTDGAFRLTQTDHGLRLTPLPDSPPFLATFQLDKLGLGGAKVKQVIAHEIFAPNFRAVEFLQKGNALSLKHEWDLFDYEILVEKP